LGNNPWLGREKIAKIYGIFLKSYSDAKQRLSFQWLPLSNFFQDYHDFRDFGITENIINTGQKDLNIENVQYQNFNTIEYRKTL
jgi:hypothetical protein